MSSPSPLRETDPRRVGGFVLTGRIGTGGQGTVYLAEGPDGAPVAVKTLNSEVVDDPGMRQRFVREAQAARQVASFCTAAVLAVDFDARPPYIVSEYVDGPTLQDHVAARGPMGGGELGRLAVATATALVAIHEAGIVHRDLKPGNVLLGGDGARVIDFGIAQNTLGSATMTNSPIGTPAFMAPEQIAHGRATAASDVFSWGAVIAYAATGSSPFEGTTVHNVLHNVVNVEPDLQRVPEPLRSMVAGALAKDPAQRPGPVDVLMTLLGRQGGPSDAGTLVQAAHAAQATMVDPNAAQQPGATAAAPKKRSGARGWLIGAGAVVAGAALFLAGLSLGGGLDGLTNDPGNTQVGSDQSAAGDPGEEGQGQAEPSEEPDEPASGDRELDPAEGVPRFSQAHEGDWEGVADNGALVELQTQEGDQTGQLDIDHEDCDTDLNLSGSTDRGYNGVVSFESTDSDADQCLLTQPGTVDEQVAVIVDGDTMAIDFFEQGDAGGEPVTTLSLARTDD
ncbi:serine/threonine protein kinase [Nocardiopsis sp. HNM0947]|uniref:Serine/threonine protein kinase n=1 Tax=Nocardiopsis coralli TaxID=2772213 RepID=A0ABR9PBT0_9ACTN|nr:serine/threonine-protein kinase [Nocardiopsis coralli]MBE3001293.1 serine/threonine protein kinase [Nocardiopsis coralli]